MIEETREIGKKISAERRFFISSLPVDAKQIAKVVGVHWLIENALHRTLDVIFDEDNLRVRKKNAGQNMAIIRHVVLNMLGNAKNILKMSELRHYEKKLLWETLDSS